jgi:hypothetical protein
MPKTCTLEYLLQPQALIIDHAFFNSEEGQILYEDMLFMILFERIYGPKEIEYDAWAMCRPFF